MTKAISLLLILISFAGLSSQGSPQQINPGACSYASINAKSGNIKVSISTGHYFSDHSVQTVYREGEAVDAVVWMTNTGDAPVCVCSSSPLSQNRPQLIRDGKPVPYLTGRAEWIEKYWNSNEPCYAVFRPFEVRELKPHVKTKVDWFIVSEGKHQTGNIKWFDTLGVGHYQLKVTRKFACCAGPERESDTTSFEIVEDDFIYTESVNRLAKLSAAKARAFKTAWSELLADVEIPEKSMDAYNIELIEKEDSYLVYFHSRSREKFFSQSRCDDAAARAKFGLIGADAVYSVMKSDYSIPGRSIGISC